jgi:hypothetical protein
MSKSKTRLVRLRSLSKSEFNMDREGLTVLLASHSDGPITTAGIGSHQISQQGPCIRLVKRHTRVSSVLPAEYRVT